MTNPISNDPPDIKDIEADLPNRSDSQDQFTSKANRFFSSLPEWQASLSSLSEWQQQCAVQTHQYMNTAQQAVDDSQAQVSLAEQQVQLASQERLVATEQADRAQAAADEAYASANFIGNWSEQTGDVSEPVSVAHNGVSWLSLQPMVDIAAIEPGVHPESSAYWHAVGVAAPIGTVQLRTNKHEPGWLPFDGSNYLKSAYPDLDKMYPYWSYDLHSKVNIPNINIRAHGLSFSAQEDLLVATVSGSSTGVYFWSLPSGQRVTAGFPSFGSYGLLGASFHPVNNNLLVISGQGVAFDNEFTTAMYDISDIGNPVKLVDDSQLVTANYGQMVRFKPDGTQLVIVTNAGAMVAKTSDFSKLFDIPGKSMSAWSPDGTRLAIANNETKRLEIYETNAWQKIAESSEVFSGHSSDGLDQDRMVWADSYIAFCSIGHLDQIRGLYVYSEQLDLLGFNTDIDPVMRNDSPPNLVTISSDGAYMMTSVSDRVYELPSFSQVSLPMKVFSQDCLRFSPSAQYLVGGANGTPGITLLNAKSQTQITIPELPSTIQGTDYKVRGSII
jgi:hypothetical protein